MARRNVPVRTDPVFTHEGGRAYPHLTAEQELSRSVCACLLWENTFYEDGADISDRIESLCPKVSPDFLANLAVGVRSKGKLRHVPLLMARELARHPGIKDSKIVEHTVASVIQRTDELAEFLAIYWGGERRPISHPVQRGLARAFTKFDEYQLGKYDRKDAIKLRDVLFLCHAKPLNEEMDHLWKKLIGGFCANCWGRDPGELLKIKDLHSKNVRFCGCGNYTEAKLATPYTWEVELSAGQREQKEVWTDLITSNKLGAMALLRNLRNMVKAEVPKSVILAGLNSMKVDRVLPYRFIAAAKYAVDFEPELEKAMFKCLYGHEKLAGHTVLLVDVSGSMDQNLSSKSDLKRLDAACGLAMLLREICDNVDVYTFSHQLVKVPPRRGFALRDVIVKSQPHGGTWLGTAVNAIYGKKSVDIAQPGGFWTRTNKFVGEGLKPDRLIVITDEQAHDEIPDRPAHGFGYVINVASYQRGVGYGPWNHIDGFSESVIDWLQEYERPIM